MFTAAPRTHTCTPPPFQYEHIEPTDDSDSQQSMRRRTRKQPEAGAGKSAHLAPNAAPKSVQFAIKETAAAKAAAPAAAPTSATKSEYVPPRWMDVSREDSKTDETRTDDTQVWFSNGIVNKERRWRIQLYAVPFFAHLMLARTASDIERDCTFVIVVCCVNHGRRGLR